MHLAASPVEITGRNQHQQVTLQAAFYVGIFIAQAL